VLKLTAAAGMTEGEFRSRVALALREKRDAGVEALRRKYAARLGTLEDRERRAVQKVEKEKAQVSDKTLSTALSVGGSLLGALFGGGRRGSAISKASSAARGVSRVGKERADVAHAEADASAVRAQIEALNAELEAEVARLESELDPATVAIEAIAVKPRKADLTVEGMALVWVP
jgi:copper chaperone CopZ